MSRRKSANVADVLDRARASVAAARLARHRSEEIRLHILARRQRPEAVEVDPASAAALREHLSRPRQ